MKINFSKYLKGLDAVLITSNPNIIYLLGFSSIDPSSVREVMLLITKKKKYIFTDPRSSEMIRKQTNDFEIIDTGVLSFIYKSSGEFFKTNKIKTLGFEENDLTFKEHQSLSRYAKLKPYDLSNIRIIKSGDEIKKIERANKIVDRAFKYILGELKTGVTEKEIANKIELFFKQNGADRSFNSVVAFGANSSVLHHVPGKNKLKKNSIVLLDVGSKLDDYCCDFTRTVFFGHADNKFKDIYQTVLEAQRLAIEKIKPGIKASELDKISRDYIMSKGYPNMIHSLGHGTGIEVHEAPHVSTHSKEIIQNGMVFSVEPGIYIPGYGGVRIEDLIAVVKGKPQLISSTNHHIIEV